jgi:hypothetical protein
VLSTCAALSHALDAGIVALTVIRSSGCAALAHRFARVLREERLGVNMFGELGNGHIPSAPPYAFPTPGEALTECAE